MQGPQRCLGSCSKSTDTAVAGNNGSGSKADACAGAQCFKCHEPDVDDLDACSIALDLGNARSAPGIDLVPTFTTSNKRICLLLATGQMGLLRIEDAERLQVRATLVATLRPRERVGPSCLTRARVECRVFRRDGRSRRTRWWGRAWRLTAARGHTKRPMSAVRKRRRRLASCSSAMPSPFRCSLPPRALEAV